MSSIIIPKFDPYVRNGTNDIRLNLKILSRRIMQGIPVRQGFCFFPRDTIFVCITTIIQNILNFTIKRIYRFYDLVYDEKTRLLKGFSLNEEKGKRARRESGFFANTAHGADFDAVTAQDHY